MDKEQKGRYKLQSIHRRGLQRGNNAVFQRGGRFMIRKIKKLLFITVTTITIGFALTGCGAEATDNIDIGVYEWIDPDTQVHYIYNGAGGVSVRYNADGTIMHD